MCGIVGYITKTDKSYAKEKQHFMRFALALDTLRGYDSTGVMTVGGRGFEVDIRKSVLPGDLFVKTQAYKDQWSAGWAKVGHNRSATVGKVTEENAHPFSIGDISLVHNGTLWGGGSTLENFDDALLVDSQQIANALATVTPLLACEVISEIDGSFALVWFDKRDKSVNMVRNSERPLHYSLNSHRDALWFMSDGHHLHSIMKGMIGSSGTSRSIYSLDKNFLLKWKKGSLVPEVTKIAPFVQPVYRPYGKSATDDDTKSGTALDRATEVWKRQLEKAQSGNTMRTTKAGTDERPRVLIANKTRCVPWPQLNALRDEYDLAPENLLRFTPERCLKLSNEREMVIGKIYHPGWGDCEWNAVLYDAKKLQVSAYMNYDWLVMPIGIGHNWDKKHDAPSVLCSVIHCDWQSYNKSINKEAQDSGKVPTPSVFYVKNSHIPVSYAELRPMLESGCISCASELTTKELSQCEIVNEGRDLLCPGCVKELRDNLIH